MPASQTTAITGIDQAAARIVLLTAHAHQKEAKLINRVALSRGSSGVVDTAAAGNSSRTPASVALGSSVMQQNVANIVIPSLTSHWSMAETGRVMCQECVPHVRSSPSDRLPARIAIT